MRQLAGMAPERPRGVRAAAPADVSRRPVAVLRGYGPGAVGGAAGSGGEGDNRAEDVGRGKGPAGDVRVEHVYSDPRLCLVDAEVA